MAADSSLQVRADLVDAQRVDLVGPIREDEVLRQAPSRWYLTSFLVPKGAPEEQRVDPTVDEEVAAGGADGSGADGSADDDTADASPKHRRSYFPLTPAPSCELVDRVPQAAGEVARLVGERVNAHRRNVEGTARHVQERVHTLFSDWSGAVAALGAAAVHVHYSRMETRGGVRPFLRTAVDERDEDEPRLNRFVAPTSIRDVEPGVHVWVA